MSSPIAIAHPPHLESCGPKHLVWRFPFRVAKSRWRLSMKKALYHHRYQLSEVARETRVPFGFSYLHRFLHLARRHPNPRLLAGQSLLTSAAFLSSSFSLLWRKDEALFSKLFSSQLSCANRACDPLSKCSHLRFCGAWFASTVCPIDKSKFGWKRMSIGSAN